MYAWMYGCMYVYACMYACIYGRVHVCIASQVSELKSAVDRESKGRSAAEDALGRIQPSSQRIRSMAIEARS